MISVFWSASSGEERITSSANECPHPGIRGDGLDGGEIVAKVDVCAFYDQSLCSAMLQRATPFQM